MIVETLTYLFIAAIGLVLVWKFNQPPQSARKLYSKPEMLAYLSTCTSPPVDWKSIESFKKQYQEKLNKPSIRVKSNSKGASMNLPIEDIENIDTKVTLKPLPAQFQDKENIDTKVTLKPLPAQFQDKENAVPLQALQETRKTEDLKLAGQLLHDMENKVMDVKRKLLDNFPLQERKRVPLGNIINLNVPKLNPDVAEFKPMISLNPDAPDFRPSYLL